MCTVFIGNCLEASSACYQEPPPVASTAQSPLYKVEIARLDSPANNHISGKQVDPLYSRLWSTGVSYIGPGRGMDSSMMLPMTQGKCCMFYVYQRGHTSSLGFVIRMLVNPH